MVLYDDLEDGFTETSAGKLHYKQRESSGKKVIFLHGFGASTRSYAKLVSLLPENLGIYLLDLLGHGDSDAPHIEYSIGLQTKLVKEFFEKKQLQDSYLFGHSYGGWIAASIAQGNYKGNGIILEDSMGLKETFDDIERSGKADEWKEKWIADALVFNPRDYVIRSSVNSQPKQEYLTRESLSSIVKPSLVVWGSEDSTLSVKYARLFNEYIKGSALEVIRGARHVAHYTHADVVSRLISKFIGS